MKTKIKAKSKFEGSAKEKKLIGAFTELWVHTNEYLSRSLGQFERRLVLEDTMKKCGKLLADLNQPPKPKKVA